MAVIDRVKFDALSDDVLVWKWPGVSGAASEALSIGTQLIVNQSQEAILVKGGQALDLFGPGTHTLATDNIPLLRKLVNLPFGGRTPFTAEVWYINKTVKRDLPWGTTSPIPLIDAKYEYPISVRAYGQWGMRIADSRAFVTQLVGSRVAADSKTVEDYFLGEIVQRVSSALAAFVTEQRLSVFDINTHLNNLSLSTAQAIQPEFGRFGIEVINFNVMRVSIPPEEQKKFQEVLGKKMEIQQIGQATVGQGYTVMRTFDTLEKAAQNEGSAGSLLAGGLGLGVGLGAGVPVGQQLGQALSTAPTSGGQAGEPAERLRKLKALLDAGVITAEDYERKKKEILDDL